MTVRFPAPYRNAPPMGCGYQGDVGPLDPDPASTYAPIVSPIFTGDPQAPTPPPGDSDASVATTAFVSAAITAAPNKLITLSGDIAGSGTAGIVTTLPAVNANVGTFQGLTVNGKGQVTAAANQGYATATTVTAGDNLRVLKAGDTMSGPLTVVNAAVAVQGAAGGFGLQDRTTSTTNWVVYADVGRFRIYAGSDLLTMDTGGNVYSNSILPVSDNTKVLGFGATAWNDVRSYGFTNASGVALKQDIEAAPSALEHLVALQPRTFRWRAGPDTERRHHGFLAHEVRDALGADFGGYRAEPDAEGIAYHELIAVLWKAVQELSAKVAALEVRDAA